MRWVVWFTDSPGMLEVRKTRAQAHVEYVRKHEAEILIGGGLRPGPDEAFSGGLWVLEVPDRQRAVELVENDPYFNPEHRTYQLFTWGKILEDRMVTL